MKKTILFLGAVFLISIGISSFRFQQNQLRAAIVNADKMNVFYNGIDNPVSVSVPGVPADKIKVSLSGAGTITSSGAPGKYIVRVRSGTETNVEVDYTDNNGKLVELAGYRFRIKRAPDPVCYVGNIKAIGSMTRAEFQTCSGVFARMENFDFDLRYTVASFELSTYSDSAYVTHKANGPAFTAEMKSQMHKGKTGDRFYIERVTVKGPDGALRLIPGTTVVLK